MNIGNSFNSASTNYINQNKTNTEETLSKIGAVRELSGKDSANLISADALSLQISTLTQGIQNSNEAVGVLQIADAALSNISQNTSKLNELSVKSNNAALNSSQKEMIQEEFNATKDAIQDIVDNTSYNGKSLFNESLSFETGSGTITIPSLSVDGLDSVSMSEQESIEDFANAISSLQSDVGSSSQEFGVSIANSLSAVSNLTNSYENISEEPIDTKINDLEKNQIKLESSIIAQNHETQTLQQRVSALLV
ncbi:flagellin [Sulfurospirillum arcachonense]|uniref:flagellin n=1 Tax=Sulfurospirillum arcachonense TaxID=57666 RepID=UPI000468784C|nr:flagellin [Sulfurospirillum arcachonense]